MEERKAGDGGVCMRARMPCVWWLRMAGDRANDGAASKASERARHEPARVARVCWCGGRGGARAPERRPAIPPTSKCSESLDESDLNPNHEPHKPQQ